jgi:hypothetical protein
MPCENLKQFGVTCEIIDYREGCFTKPKQNKHPRSLQQANFPPGKGTLAMRNKNKTKSVDIFSK